MVKGGVLRVDNLTAKIKDKIVLKDISFKLDVGQNILLMGPNASGKTSLVQVILGNPNFKIINGRIYFEERDITDLSLEERVKLGISASFQFPPKLRGIKLRRLVEKILRKRGVSDIEGEVTRLAKLLRLDNLIDRDFNIGFSGGEMRRAELMLLLAQNPKLVLLDEIDSGVDVENIAVIGRALNEFLSNSGRASLIVSHTGFIARYIKFDRACVMVDGRIVCWTKPEVVLKTVLEYGFDKCITCKGGGLWREILRNI